jgi:glycosyltransferase involved in cell wall biosynthesis
VAWQVRRLAPDLVYGRYLQGCFFCSLLGMSVIYEAHMLPTDLRSLDAWMHAGLLHSTHLKRLVLISHALKQDYKKTYGAPDAFITVAPDAADRPRTDQQLILENPHKLHVGYIGNLYAGRGIEIILDIAQACRWADFHIVGGQESDVHHWKSRSAPLENVFFYGFVPPAMTDQYRQACDILIAPYQSRVLVYGEKKETSQWMSPLKIFEYMAAGKAIVTSNLPAVREILQHGVTAFLCDPDEVSSWIHGLNTLRDNLELRTQLGQRARKAFETHYTWEARAALVLKDV